jgi:hypothetical protein
VRQSALREPATSSDRYAGGQHAGCLPQGTPVTQERSAAHIPDFSTEYQSYFKADNLRAGPLTLTIKSVGVEKISPQSDDTSPVLWVIEDKRGVVLNKTRYEQIAEIFGSPDTDKWIGNKVVAFLDPSVKFGGKKVGGIAFKPTA